MKTIKNFDWILNIFNEVIITNENYDVVFCGSEIKKTLFGQNKECSENFLNNFTNEKVRSRIKKKIGSVRSNGVADSLELKESGKTLYLFPAKYNKASQIIISTNEDILFKSKMELDLNERIKELECLYNISSEFELTDNIDEALNKSIKHVINGFQYPEVTTANFVIDSKNYGMEDCHKRESKYVLSHDIVVNKISRGQIYVCSEQDHTFLPEEKKLIKEISVMISKAIENEDQIADTEHKRRLLLLKNERLLELTEECGESRKNLETLINAITDTILVVDSEFNVEMSNQNENGNQEKCYERLFDFNQPCDHCPTLNTFETAEATSTEYEIGGEYFRLKSYPIFNDSGDVDRVLELVRNVTSEKQLENQLLQTDKLASLGKLVSGIAHEINNPNTFILGNLKIVKESFEEILPILDTAYEKQKDLKIARLNYDVYRENIPTLVDDMLNGADRIKKIVEDLRNFARKDEGIEKEEVNINDVVANSVRLAENQIKRNAKIKTDLSKNIPMVFASKHQIEQVVLNMIFNAIQAIEGDTGNILISTMLDKENNEALISVKDNGRGMTEKTMKSVFDPFFTTMRKEGGTGLGLSIAYGIVNDHKGSIEVESALGAGTKFTIHLPMLAQES